MGIARRNGFGRATFVQAMRLAAIMLGGLAVLAGCREAPAPGQARGGRAAATDPSARNDSAAPPAAPAAPVARQVPVEERKPVLQAPVDPNSAEAAAEVVRTCFELLGKGRRAEAGRLWEEAGKASAFAAGLGRYRDYRAEVGPPGEMEGAAGSSFVTIPVRLGGLLSDGTAFHRRIEVTLRRVNDVPGATDDQRRWRILDIAPAEAPQ
jgi:hypothetical protein